MTVFAQGFRVAGLGTVGAAVVRMVARRAEALGLTPMVGSELEFYLFRDSYTDMADGGYRELRPSSTYIMDYHMLQTTKDEWLIRQIRNGMNDAGVMNLCNSAAATPDASSSAPL